MTGIACFFIAVTCVIASAFVIIIASDIEEIKGLLRGKVNAFDEKAKRQMEIEIFNAEKRGEARGRYMACVDIWGIDPSIKRYRETQEEKL